MKHGTRGDASDVRAAAGSAAQGGAAPRTSRGSGSIPLGPLHPSGNAQLLLDESKGFKRAQYVSESLLSSLHRWLLYNSIPSGTPPRLHMQDPHLFPQVPSDTAQPGQRDCAAASLSGSCLCSVKILYQVIQTNLS